MVDGFLRATNGQHGKVAFGQQRSLARTDRPLTGENVDAGQAGRCMPELPSL
jgi:hypothetical protein